MDSNTILGDTGEQISLSHLIGKTCIVNGTIKFRVFRDSPTQEIRLEIGAGHAYYVVSEVKGAHKNGGYIVDINKSDKTSVYKDTHLIDESLVKKKK